MTWRWEGSREDPGLGGWVGDVLHEEGVNVRLGWVGRGMQRRVVWLDGGVGVSREWEGGWEKTAQKDEWTRWAGKERREMENLGER